MVNPYLCTALVAFLLSSCTPSVDFKFEAEEGNIFVRATITSVEFNYRDDSVKLSGQVVIQNASSWPQQYSNMWLWLQVGENVRERAYLDNVTSHHIDSSVVVIQPSETIELAVYWVFPGRETDNLGYDSFVLHIQPDG